MKFDMYVKNLKNMQFNNYIFKICSHVIFLVRVEATTKFDKLFLY